MRFIIDHKWYRPSWLPCAPGCRSLLALPGSGHLALASPRSPVEERRVVTSNIWSGHQTGAALWHRGETCDVSVTRGVTKHEQTTYHCNYITIARLKSSPFKLVPAAAQELRARDPPAVVKVRENISVKDGDNLWWNCKYSVKCQGKNVHKESFLFINKCIALVIVGLFLHFHSIN